MALDFAAGCVGGCAGVIVGHPLDTVKIKLQTQDINNPKYKGASDCIRRILLKDGVRGLYRGMTSPLAGVAAINAVVFGVQAQTQKRLSNPNSLSSHAISGGIAGFAQSFLCSPMELTKSRSQVCAETKGSLDCFKLIYRQDGFKGIFRGLNITILREVPAFSSYFFTYELLTRRDDDQPVSTAAMLFGGGVAGMISWFIIYPVDVVKSRLQIDGLNGTKYLNTFDCIKKSIATEGYQFLYRGLSPTLLRAFPVNAATFAVVTWTLRFLENTDVKETVVDGELLWGRYTDAINSLKVSDNAAFI